MGGATATFRCAACGAVIRVVAGGGEAACHRCRRPVDRSGRPQQVDAAALVAAIRASPAPVLVDFSPPGPASAPLSERARALAGSLLVLKVDPATDRAAAEAYAVGAGPALVLFAGGAEVARRSGATDWPDLATAVEAAPHLAPVAGR